MIATIARGQSHILNSGSWHWPRWGNQPPDGPAAWLPNSYRLCRSSAPSQESRYIKFLFEKALLRLWPLGDQQVPGLRAGIVATAPTVFAKHGITTLMLVAQISHERDAGHDGQNG